MKRTQSLERKRRFPRGRWAASCTQALSNLNVAPVFYDVDNSSYKHRTL